eukprot:Gb_21323 [translate_table: standard]
MQCHCYVCDKLAPCSFWDKGNCSTDHCHATDKEAKWKKLRDDYKLKKTQMALPPTVKTTVSLPLMRSAGQVDRMNQVVTTEVASVPLNINHSVIHQFKTMSSSTNSPNSAFQAVPISSFGLFTQLPGQTVKVGHIGSMLSSSISSTGHVGRNDHVDTGSVASFLSNISHSAAPEFGYSSSTNNLNRASQTGSASSFSVSTHLPVQDARIQVGSMLASSVCSISQVGRSSQVGSGAVSSVPSNIRQSAAHQFRSCLSVNNLKPASQTGSASSVGLPAHWPGQNVRIGQVGSMLAASMSSTDQVVRSNQVGNGAAVAPVPLNIGHIGTHQFKSCSSTNYLSPTSQTEPASSFDLPAYFPGQNVRISQIGNTLGSLISSTGQVGRNNQVCTASLEAVPMNTGCSAAQLLRSNQSRAFSSTNNLSCASYTQPASCFGFSPSVHGQLAGVGHFGSTPASSMEKNVLKFGFYDQSTMATRMNGSQVNYVEDCWGSKGSLKELLSSNSTQSDLEVCSTTQVQVVNHSADDGNLSEIFPQNACSVSSNMVEEQLSKLREFLLGSDCDDNFYIQDDSFTEMFRNCIINRSSNLEVQPLTQPTTSEQLWTSCVPSTCELQVSSGPDTSGNISNVVGNFVELPVVQLMPATSTV